MELGRWAHLGHRLGECWIDDTRDIAYIHIPKNALDVLAQQIYGIAIADKIHISELFSLITRSYCYKDLRKTDFINYIYN